jgi:hypothetical protein
LCGSAESLAGTGKLAAFAGFAAHRGCPAMECDNAVRHREPGTGAVPDTFSHEKGLDSDTGPPHCYYLPVSRQASRAELVQPSISMEMWFDLFAQQLHRPQHPLMRNEAAAVELGKYAAQTDFALQCRQLFGDRVRGADQRVVLQAVLISEAAQLIDAPHAELWPEVGDGLTG